MICFLQARGELLPCVPYPVAVVIISPECDNVSAVSLDIYNLLGYGRGGSQKIGLDYA